MPLVDIIVIGVVLLSALIAMYLGFVRVVCGIGGWIGAALVTIYGFPYVRPIARQWITDTLVADGVAVVVVFVVTLVVLSYLSHVLSRRVRESGLRPVDRSLGLLLGAFVGVFIVSAAYLLIDQAASGEDRPQWMDTAKTAPLVRRSAYFIWSLAPAGWREAAPRPDRALGRAAAEQEAQRALRTLINPVPRQDETTEKRGYSEREREEMDRLIRGQNQR